MRTITRWGQREKSVSEQIERATLEAILNGTVAIVKPGDKVIVRVGGLPLAAEMDRIRKMYQDFFGEGNFLVTSSNVEFLILRQEPASVD